MNSLQHLIGKRIVAIQRIDFDTEYDYSSPYAIIFTLEGQAERLVVSAVNNNYAVDIRVTNANWIAEDYGLEFGECLLNTLKKDDELCSFIGDNIQSIRVAEYNSIELKGKSFIIRQGKYSAVDLRTEKHRLLFQNDNGVWCDIDDFTVEPENKSRCEWK